MIEIKGTMSGDTLTISLNGRIDSTNAEDVEKQITEIREANNYDKIIIDTPPISLLADAYMIAPLVDLSLIVLHYGVHSMEAIKEALQNMNRYTDKPKAFIFNHCEHRSGYGYGYGYGYCHYVHYGSKRSKKKN